MRQVGLFTLGLCLVGCGTTIIGERNSSEVGGSAGANTPGSSMAGQGNAAQGPVGGSKAIGTSTTGTKPAVGGSPTTQNTMATGGVSSTADTKSNGGVVTMAGATSTPKTMSNGGAVQSGASGGVVQSSATGGSGTPPSSTWSGGSVGTGGGWSKAGTAGVPGVGGGTGCGGNSGGATGAAGAAAVGGAGGISGVTVQLDQAKQTMDGFGISDTWAPAMTDSEADALFNTTNGIGLSILRVSMGSDGSPMSSNIPADITKAKARGVKAIIGTAWSPPASCKSNGNVNDGGHLLSSCTDAWTDTIAKFAKDNALYAMSPQNEPDFASCGMIEPCSGNYPTAVYTANEMVALVKEVGPKLKAVGVKVIAPEPAEWIHNWSSESATGSVPGYKNSSDPLNCGFPPSATQCPLGKGYDYGHALYADKDAWAAFDILGTHQYDTQKAFPWPSDVPETKPVWVTEMSGLKWWPEQGPSSDINNGIAVAGWIHDAIVNGNASAWLWWSYSPINTDDNEGLLLKDGSDTKRHYTLGNYSKFIRPGYTRVGLGGSLPTDVLLSAYKGADGTVVVVAINKGSVPVTVPIAIAGGTAPASMKPWVTSATDDLYSKTAVPVIGGSFTAALDAKTVTTFVSSAGQLVAGGCPPCIADAIAACTPSGNCASSGGGTSHWHYYWACYENGITWEGAAADDDSSSYIKTTKKDGSACTLVDTVLSGETHTVTVTAGSSQIAQGSFDPSGQAIIECAGTPYVLEETCGAPPANSSCTLSECP